MIINIRTITTMTLKITLLKIMIIHDNNHNKNASLNQESLFVIRFCSHKKRHFLLSPIRLVSDPLRFRVSNPRRLEEGSDAPHLGSYSFIPVQ